MGWLQAREEQKRQYTPAAYQEGAKADAQRACVGREPSAVFECVYEHVEAATQASHDEQDLSAQQRAASSALAAAAVSFLTLIVTGIGVWFVKRTLDATLKAVEDTSAATEAMRDANKIAATNHQETLRPYITVAHAHFQIDSDIQPVAHVELKNFGQSPALDVQTWFSIQVECFPLHDPLPRAPEDLPKSSNIIGPGGTSDISYPRGNPLNAFSQREIMSGRAALYVFGESRYCDIWGNKFVSEFTLFSMGERQIGLRRLSAYMEGNSIRRISE